MKFNIILKKPDSAGLSRVYLFCRVNGEECFVPTKIKILKKAWDKKKKKITASQSGYEKLQGLLNKRIGQFQKVFDDLEYEGVQPTVKGVKARYKKIVNGEKEDQNNPEVTEVKVTIPDLLFKFEKSRAGLRSKNSLRMFGTVARVLEDYHEFEQRTLVASEFSIDEFNHLTSYLVDERELLNGTIYDYVQKIKYVMKNEKESPVHPDHINFTYKNHKSKPIWLDWDTEVAAIENYTPEKSLQIYKEEALFRFYTGLRWSDCNQLRPEHFTEKENGDIELSITGIKTHVNQNLVLNSKAAEIVRKWNFKVPKLHQNHCNGAIKLICEQAFEKADIKKTVERVRYSGSNRIVEMLPKWSLVTTHTARRSFGRRWIDLASKQGRDLITALMHLMKYYGHSSIEQTIQYIGYEAEEVNKEMKRLWG